MVKEQENKKFKSKSGYPEIMTINQIAEYFQISEMTTYKLVHEGTIPAFKIGRHWRVRRDDLDIFIDKLINGERI